MRTLQRTALLTCLVGITCALGCGDDDDTPSEGGKGGSGGAAQGGSATGGKATGGTTTGGKTNGDGGTTTGGTSGGAPTEGGSGGVPSEGGAPTEGGAGQGGGGGTPTDTCDIYDSTRPVEDIPTDATGNLTGASGGVFKLTSDKTWRISGRTWVPDGVTLEIEPCTLIVGTPKPGAGSLFIMRGAKLIADGTADQPIVFTSEDYKFHTNAPWGGVVLFGKAPLAHPTGVVKELLYEGLTDMRATFGGSDPEDSSGSMSYVRIEYGGDILVADKEVNGLSLGGVGSGTSLHHIMVKRQMDDCFEFFGGTVNADHLICENTGDDMFDTDNGFKGHLQYLFGRLTTQGTSADPNGFEWDGNQGGESDEDRSTPQASNATLCGLAVNGAAVSYGAVLRRGLVAGTSIENSIITGFNNGVDTRNAVGTNAAPLLSWTHSLFFGNFTNNIAVAEPVDGSTADNDNAFDEKAWILDATNANTDAAAAAPAGFDCYANPPHPMPNAAIAGSTPAAPFETTANYVGAFKNSNDNWMTGLWVDWTSGNP